MESKIDLNDIIWIETNAVWLYPILKEYITAGRNLEMNYLSLGSLRYDEKYFVGYLFHADKHDLQIELVSYIQYKMKPNKLILNYMETVERYRGNGIANAAIDKFVIKTINDPNIVVDITTLSADGRKSNLAGKFQAKLNGEISVKNKRDIM